MELFRIGGPNPDTNYLFMGEQTCQAVNPGFLLLAINRSLQTTDYFFAQVTM